MKVYTVHAFRWGNIESHSYIVGVYTSESAAIKAADVEEEWRGGKYICRIEEWTLGVGIEGDHEREGHRVVQHPADREAHW